MKATRDDEKGLMIQHTRTCIGTVEGPLDLLDPQPQHLLQLARPLSNLRRWNGHGLVDPPTVLAHLLHVAQIMRVELNVTDKDLLLYGLLHDAHEAFTGDMSRPMKFAMRELQGDAFDEIEQRGMTSVVRRFTKTGTYLDLKHPLVVQADLMALGWEADRQFGSGTGRSWDVEPARQGLLVEPTVERFLLTATHLGALNVRP